MSILLAYGGVRYLDTSCGIERPRLRQPLWLGLFNIVLQLVSVSEFQYSFHIRRIGVCRFDLRVVHRYLELHRN